MTFSTKHLFIVSLAVRLAIFHVEGLVPDGPLAGGAHEALDVIGHLQGVHDLSGNLLLALGAVWGVTVVVAFGAINGAFLLKEAAFVEHFSALTARELLRVPGAAQSHHVATSDDLVACGAEWRASGAGVGLWVLLRGLEDGAAVLLGCGLCRLPVLRHHRARLIWPIALGKVRVRHPRWPA